MKEKAAKIDVSIEAHMTKEELTKQKKRDWEISFLQTEMNSALRKRDHSFAQKEIGKLELDTAKSAKAHRHKALMATQKQLQMEKAARLMKMEADAELDEANQLLSGVEAIAQANEEWASMAPSWMVQSQLEEARKSQTQRDSEAQEH